MQIQEIMTRDVDLADPNTTIRDIARRMREENIGSLPVGENDRLIGMVTDRDIVGPAIAAEDLFQYSCLNPGMGSTIRGLVGLAPRTLALMHGPSFQGDGSAALRALADDYDRRVAKVGRSMGQVMAA